jgi:hypothetical protein
MQETLHRKIAQIDSITPQASSLIDCVIVFFSLSRSVCCCRSDSIEKSKSEKSQAMERKITGEVV